jgi:hypothetical protein
MAPWRARPQTVALGLWLGCRGLGARFALFVAFLGALVAVFVSRIRPDLWQRIPFFTAAIVAWSAGVTLAYGSALGATRSDADEGVLFLARTRGIGASEHAFGRVVGLTALLALSVAGSTFVAGMAATSVSPAPLVAVKETGSALVYAVAFATIIGPLALAALGGRSRALGYLVFVAVLCLPELVSPWTRTVLPHGWTELTSIPEALNTLHSPESFASLLRALSGLTAVVVCSVAVVALRARHVAQKEMP